MRTAPWPVAFAIAGCLLSRGPAGAEGGAPDKPGAGKTPPRAEAESARRFEAEIAPILARHCLECHDAGSRKGRLDLSRREAALAGGKSGPAIAPGKAAASLLWQHVASGEMPKNRPPLADREKETLREWIDAGAAWTLEVIDPAAYARRRGPPETWVQRLTVPEYIETVRCATGVDVEREARRLLPPDIRADGFTNTAYSLGIDLAHVEAYARLAETIAGRMDVVKLAAEHASCRELTDACLREVISGVGKRLLRGPLAEEEVAAFLRVSRAVTEEKGDFSEAVRHVIEAMLQSPRFLYRIEDRRGDGSLRPAGGFELASRLSYILWGAPPDGELMRAAGAGELADRGRVEAQVRRMLEDPRAVERSLRFLREWLDLDRLENLRPDPGRFPGWDRRLAADMRDETLAFFEHVAWKEKRPLQDIMNAQVTFATPRLAAHYGLDGNPPGAGAGESEAARPPERVTAGLEVLYTFEEGGGDRVRDVSGTGEPIHLRIADPSAVRWTDAGLTVHASTLISRKRPPSRLIEAFRKSGEITIEAWVTPASAAQKGPARIVTLSDSVVARNFTLGQEGDRFDVRLRTTATSESGTPSLGSEEGAAGTDPVHVVYTRDRSGAAAVYIDGAASGRGEVGGDLSGWDGGFRLALANEMSRDRTWLGTFHLVAVYRRALSASEVERNHAAGTRGAGPPVPAGEQGLEALYTFEDGEGEAIRDTSNAGTPLDLRIEDASGVAWGRDGLRVEGRALIATASPPERLTGAIKKSSAFTLEAWITPGDTGQKGPARIVTLSSGTGDRNFTLGQDGDRFDLRCRTTKTDRNGMPSMASKAGAVRKRPVHVVATRDAAGKARLYVGGEEQASRDIGGDLSGWDDGFRLAIGNETTKDRAWKGTFRRIAIHSRALGPGEIRARGEGPPPRAARPRRDGPRAPAAPRRIEALYTFEDGKGDTIRDASGAGAPLDLRIEDASGVEWKRGGLVVDGRTLIATTSPPKRLTGAIKKSGAFTLEAWITPGDTDQKGPARIVTLSSGTSDRNFTLGQDGDRFDLRLRTTKTDRNGMPSMASKAGAVRTRPVHVATTRDAAGKARLYVDGEEQASRDTGGDLSSWDDGFRLALGNETSKDRGWKGTFHRIAIHGRALGPEEIRARDEGPSRHDLASVPARGGLLTQGSVLTLGGDDASMVARGLFILHDILDDRVGSPPPCVDTTPVPAKPGLSNRAIAEARVADPSCGGCHSRFEPLAFGLERFDGTGAYHETDEHGNALREDGSVLFPGAQGPAPYRSSAEMMDLLAGSERVRRTLTRKVAQFALGRPLVEADLPALERVHEAAREAGGTYAAVITAIVLGDLVQMVRTETAGREGE